MKKDVVRKIVAPIMILAAIVLLCWPAVAHIQSA